MIFLSSTDRAKGLKLVIQAVIISVSNIQNIVMVSLLLVFLFACIGVQLFKGKFYMCTDSSKMTEVECQGTFIDYEESDTNRPIMRYRSEHYSKLFSGPFFMKSSFCLGSSTPILPKTTST